MTMMNLFNKKLQNLFIDKTGFYEYEIARKVEEFGHVVHVWSTFESKYSKKDEEN